MTQQLLSEAHSEMARSMKTEEELFDYLLSSMNYLKENNLDGWKENFKRQENGKIEKKEPPIKKRRMSPNVVLMPKRRECTNCKSDAIIDDVKEGSVVCTACGIIQSTQLIQSTPAHMSANTIQEGFRHVVHRYSRVVYFRSFLLSIQGLTTPTISPKELQSLQATLSGDAAEVTPNTIEIALKKLKKSTKFRRHKVSLAVTLSKNAYKPVVVPYDTFCLMLKLFRRVEVYWQQHSKRLMPGRCVFLSYPYLYYQFCVHLKCTHLSSTSYLLQSRVLLKKLHVAYKEIAANINLDCDTDTYR